MTLYALRPAPETGSIDDAEVVDRFKYGWGFLEQAVMLWRLVDPARANQINAIMDRVALAAGDGELRIDAEDLRELVQTASWCSRRTASPARECRHRDHQHHAEFRSEGPRSPGHRFRQA
jgi:hypothetical protein